MKRKDLEKRLRDLNWYFLRHGSNHDIWTNGEDQESVPRHKEIDEYLAKKILRNVRLSKGEN